MSIMQFIKSIFKKDKSNKLQQENERLEIELRALKKVEKALKTFDNKKIQS